MDDHRIGRIEQRVDEIKDDVTELKIESHVQKEMLHSMKTGLEDHYEIVQRHVLGDNKIITEIQPLLNVLPHLAEMVEDHKYRRENTARRNEKLKNTSVKLGLVGATVGILTGLVKFFDLF